MVMYRGLQTKFNDFQFQSGDRVIFENPPYEDRIMTVLYVKDGFVYMRDDEDDMMCIEEGDIDSFMEV